MECVLFNTPSVIPSKPTASVGAAKGAVFGLCCSPLLSSWHHLRKKNKKNTVINLDLRIDQETRRNDKTFKNPQERHRRGARRNPGSSLQYLF